MNNIRVAIGAAIRDFNYHLVFNWILRRKSQLLIANRKSAIVFSPHQDDETFGCGGMIALKRAQGVPVMVVFLTDGRYGKPDWIEPEDIIQYRQQEAANAIINLGIAPSETKFLGYADGTLNNLSPATHHKLIAQLVEIIRSFEPDEVYTPHHQDGHPDHEATYKLVEEAIVASNVSPERLQYPIWAFWCNPFSSPSTTKNSTYRLSIASVKSQKKLAIDTYKSQTPNLPSSLIAAFSSPYEIFFKS